MRFNLKSTIKSILPKWLKRVLRGAVIFFTALSYYCSDMRRYLRFSTTLCEPKQYRQMEARIISHYHALEKALSFRDKKAFFGEEVSKSLVNLLEKYIAYHYPTDRIFFHAALDTLKKYIDYHLGNKNPGEYLNDIKNRIDKLGLQGPSDSGGTLKIYQQEILTAARGDFAALSSSRHSIRDFSSEEVRMETIFDAVKLAQACPSECNRQTVKVVAISDKDLIKKSLELQTGNRGFGHLVNKLLVVVSDLEHFEGAIERNQTFVDGGIFTMSLLYALHYKGLGACPLNWASSPKKDKALRKLLDLPESATVIVFIAVGNLPEELYVARSARKSTEEILA